jgi:hypothetical protein
LIVEGYFDRLFLTDSTFGEPQIVGQRLAIPFRGLGLMPGHPLNTTNQVSYLPQGRLVFDRVRSSQRTISEYLRSPSENAFKPERTVITDGPFPPVTEPLRRFELEGVSERPPGWIAEWTIEAALFQLEI